MIDPKKLSEIINELGEDREDYFQSVAPPIMQTSNFSFNSVEALRNAFQDEASTYLYSRATNPTLKILEQKMAALDGAEASLIFNSGAGTIFTAVLANVKSGDHIISVEKPYTWAQKMFDHVLPRFNITTTYVDGKDIKILRTPSKTIHSLFTWKHPIAGVLNYRISEQWQNWHVQRIF